MQNFLIVNCKGASLEDAIMNMHAQLTKLRGEPDTAVLEIFTVNFINTFEKPQRTALDLNGNNQPVIVYNINMILVQPVHKAEPDWDELAHLVADRIADRLTGVVDAIVNDETDPADQPTDKEIQDLKTAARAFCQHTNLDPAKHSKAYRNPGQWFQLCKDCGAEVWSGLTDQHPAPAVFPAGEAGPWPNGGLRKVEDPDRARGQDI